MSDPIRYISKVEIKGLWGKFDIEWDLQQDVNVLSGINGSGKSTILNCISKLLMSNTLANNGNLKLVAEIGKCIQSCKLSFESGDYVLYEFVNKNDEVQREKTQNKFKQYKHLKPTFFGTDYLVFMALSLNALNVAKLINVDAIATFDTELKSSEAVTKLSDETIKTELDFEIYDLQKKYLGYQLNIGKRIFEAINRKEANPEVIDIQASQNRFLEIIDTLFEETGKTINREENEISFLLGDEKITAYQLSSGEKQMLVILLTVLVQDNKNAILFMDEPEVSLHFDWQKKLIGYIRELNPNVQIILATHSPAVIMDGWLDKVANVSDLIKPAVNN